MERVHGVSRSSNDAEDEAEDPDFVPLEREELGGLEDEQEYELGRRCDLPGIAPYSQRNERMVASDNLTEF